MKRRTLVLAGHFGRFSLTMVGSGLLLIGLGYALQTVSYIRASEREA